MAQKCVKKILESCTERKNPRLRFFMKSTSLLDLFNPKSTHPMHVLGKYG